MEIIRLSSYLAVVFSLACCATTGINAKKIRDVYVADFGTEDINVCGPKDVDLSHAEALEFFKRAKQVEHRVIHDHYEYGPCYIEGTLKYKDKSCDWEIRAGATGHIECGGSLYYYACDTCENLFN